MFYFFSINCRKSSFLCIYIYSDKKIFTNFLTSINIIYVSLKFIFKPELFAYLSNDFVLNTIRICWWPKCKTSSVSCILIHLDNMFFAYFDSLDTFDLNIFLLSKNTVGTGHKFHNLDRTLSKYKHIIQ